mmetsp:Transcript_11591/g.24458  ORF Transcript_11591/g.24458 Transcript_11591/m.24458 type:complete len:101 (+) Transcript_11591:1119-1421(+)
MNSAIGTLRSLIRNRDDQERELRQLTKSVRKTMSMQKREVKGVGDIVFTVGKEETTVFEKENESRRDRGEAHSFWAVLVQSMNTSLWATRMDTKSLRIRK